MSDPIDKTVIDLTSRQHGKQAPVPRPPHFQAKRIIAIASGKGGVGKTNVVANLGYALGGLGKEVLIFDADLGLGNLDVLLGLAPRWNLSHVLTEEKQLQEIIVSGPGNLKILPAASGIQEMTHLSSHQRQRILKEIEQAIDPFDILLIDTPAGISSDVLYFNASAQEVLVIVTPEPTSLTDAYALMKVLYMKYSERRFKIVVNQASSSGDAEQLFDHLKQVCDRFLNISITYFGAIPFDANLTRSVRRQELVSERFPQSESSRAYKRLADTLIGSPPAPDIAGGQSLWKPIAQRESSSGS